MHVPARSKAYCTKGIKFLQYSPEDLPEQGPCSAWERMQLRFKHKFAGTVAADSAPLSPLGGFSVPRPAAFAPGRAISPVTFTAHKSDRQDSETEARNKAQQAQKGATHTRTTHPQKTQVPVPGEGPVQPIIPQRDKRRNPKATSRVRVAGVKWGKPSEKKLKTCL